MVLPSYLFPRSTPTLWLSTLLLLAIIASAFGAPVDIALPTRKDPSPISADTFFIKRDNHTNQDVSIPHTEEMQSSTEFSQGSFRSEGNIDQQALKHIHHTSNIVPDTSASASKTIHVLSKRFGLHEGGRLFGNGGEGEGGEGDNREDHSDTEDTQLIDDHAASDWHDELDPYFAHDNDLKHNH